ncbi:FKBP-type peptidyl-prolyl cis-trans isomerase [Roseitranquillus sediminis]|uniref:FKBP-type peptidyl-prolyl cis-trans isomerase n=1 Tax=Roseitranquillus sediminis TaxID=2809051 RepID=UPI001D0C7C56|nr:peptidylprolyl isomerase [Roseitranquillus sediminis]MBM9596046.1 peptidylprolyl isomerase [Roseitranquillus sediminis]
MSKANAGDTVAMHYTGSLSDGTRFDSSEGREPLKFTLGQGEIIPGLERAVEGMEPGEEKTVTIPADEAYGARDPSRVQTVPREQVPPEVPTDPGTQLELQTPAGHRIPVVVTERTESEVTLDANHPLAGKDLTFDVKLVEID